MEKNGTTDFDQYIEAWTRMMITIWEQRLEFYEIGVTGALKNSLQMEIIRQANGDVAKINHFFLYYGQYVDRGVGKEIWRGNPGDLGFTPKREKKPWIQGKYWYSKEKLKAEMIEQTGEFYLVSLSDVLTGKP